jgi:hypothetical protein
LVPPFLLLLLFQVLLEPDEVDASNRVEQAAELRITRCLMLAGAALPSGGKPFLPAGAAFLSGVGAFLPAARRN